MGMGRIEEVNYDTRLSWLVTQRITKTGNSEIKSNLVQEQVKI